MHEFLNTIRELKTPFKVLQNSTEEIVLAVENATSAGRSCSAAIHFLRPTQLWANQWDEVNHEWSDVRGFSMPELGEINEAYIKPTGGLFKLSFSDKRIPLVRWGFTAENVQIVSDA